MAEFKVQVYACTNVLPEKQLLTFAGKLLCDDHVLGDYRIDNYSIIDLTIKLLGGGCASTKVYKEVFGSLMSGSTKPECPSPPHSNGLRDPKSYYQKQSCWTLGSEEDRVPVPVYISESVHKDWIYFIEKGIDKINIACPGVHLFLGEQSTSKIIIQRSTEESCHTDGNIFTLIHGRKCTITLSHNWPNKVRTSVHELLHALGMAHEHQAVDASMFVHNKCPPDLVMHRQCKPLSDVCPITAMDPFSIMMYPEGDDGDYLLRKDGNNPVWNLKEPGKVNNEMSELDKVTLNQLFRPCRSAAYKPVLSPHTRMWYCGRRVMQNHNRPAASTTDGYCGPNKWANCPACRSLKNTVVDEFVRNGLWQGSSGLVYCGMYFGKQKPRHDGYCGPNNGPPCLECGRILDSEYQY